MTKPHGLCYNLGMFFSDIVAGVIVGLIICAVIALVVILPIILLPIGLGWLLALFSAAVLLLLLRSRPRG